MAVHTYAWSPKAIAVGDRAWLIHDSGAFGPTYVPVTVAKVNRVRVTVIAKSNGRKFTVNPGVLAWANPDDWEN